MNLLPDDVGAISAIVIIIASFFTSALTAGLGLGGGIALLAIMSGLLPPIAVVPIHGVAQLGSNFGRFALQRHYIDWSIIQWFVIGTAFGTFVGGHMYVALPEWVLRAGVAAFILWTVWGPKPSGFRAGNVSFLGTGAVGSFLSMFFGATGPIVAGMLTTTTLDRLQFSATHAACMVAQHGLKIVVFAILGFAFADWVPLLIALVSFGFLGTWTGTKILQKSSEQTFQKGIKAALSVMAVYLLVVAAYTALKIS